MEGVRGEAAHDSVDRAVGDDGELFSAGQVIKLKNSIGFAVYNNGMNYTGSTHN